MSIAKKIITAILVGSFAFFPLNLFKEKEEKDTGWFPFHIPWNYCEDSRIDMSFLLDAPAGKHGFLTVKDGHFYFEDGTRARFWGLNIHSNRALFPTHDQAEDIARRLAQLGCNIVRMHFLDYEAPGGVIDGRYDDSQHLSDSQMDRLDYFIYQLKENGIYVCFDVLGLGARRFKPGDNLPESDGLERGARGVSFFNERIIELSRKFAFDFLTHTNPYTGKSYINEPAVALVEMTNENTILLKDFHKYLSPYYRKEIQGLWERWLRDRGMEPQDAESNWSDDRKFLYELQDGYQKEMHEYLRSIGVKVPIGASNIPYDNLLLLADSHMDFTDIHVYWDHNRMKRIHNRPLIRQSHLNPHTIINRMATAKVFNKPLISTEWGSLWPNSWRAMDILSTASYARLNDWDGVFIYCYNGGWGLSWDDLEEKIHYPTVIFNDPSQMGLFPLASLIFLRGDVSVSENVYKISYDVSGLFEKEDSYEDRIPFAGISYVSRLEKDFYESGNAGSTVDYPVINGISSENTEIISDTGELIRDFKKGTFILKTPRTFSFSGFVGTEKNMAFNGITFNTDSDFSTLTITSLDGRVIPESRRLLLAVIGRARNKGQKLAPHFTKKEDDLKRDVYVLRRGTGPILVKGTKAEVLIEKRNAEDSIKVFSLDENGARAREIPVDSIDGKYRFQISEEDTTIYYEISRI